MESIITQETENQPLKYLKDSKELQENILKEIEIIPQPESVNKIYNINIGILGHVDSGKTTLSKKLSSIASTASFDKNPQSKSRGITLDLGFSAFYIKTPPLLKEYFKANVKLANSEIIQFTLVDCPGHASLIKTVVAGSSIIDSMILVIDYMKGIQIQTVECILLSQILCDKICIAFNKVDLAKNEEEINKKISKLRMSFAHTKFGVNVPITPISSLNDNNNNNNENTSDLNNVSNINNDEKIKKLIYYLLTCINFSGDIENIKKNEFLMFVDHCFNIKNKGSIITGTVIKGNIKVNDDIYFPSLMQKKQVKEIQIFKKSANQATKGDRIGMLIKNLDSNQIERTVICSCNSNNVLFSQGGLFIIRKINLFKSDLLSNNKYFFMIGNQGINGKIIFFNLSENLNNDNLLNLNNYKDDLKKYNLSENEIKEFYKKEFDYIEKIEYIKDDENNKNIFNKEYYFALVKFDNKILIPNDMLFLGSKIDIDISEKVNRLAFYGKILDGVNLDDILPKLKIFKYKTKEGKILRMIEDNIGIVIGLYKTEKNNTNNKNINNFIGKKVYIKQDNEHKIEGEILSTFGQTGKLKIKFNQDLEKIKLKDNENNDIDFKNFDVVLKYKKYIKLNKM